MKPTIPDVLPVANAYYAKPGNSVGGNLHIVLEDGNVETSFVKWCIDEATKQNDADGVALGNLLLQMSTTQRSKLRHQITRPRPSRTYPAYDGEDEDEDGGWAIDKDFSATLWDSPETDDDDE